MYDALILIETRKAKMKKIGLNFFIVIVTALALSTISEKVSATEVSGEINDSSTEPGYIHFDAKVDTPTT